MINLSEPKWNQNGCILGLPPRQMKVRPNKLLQSDQIVLSCLLELAQKPCQHALATNEERRHAVQPAFAASWQEYILRTEALRFLMIAILVMNLFWPSFAMGQSSSNRGAGSYIATGLLMRLANPKDTNFRVGIVNTAAEFGVLVTPKGAPLAAEYFRGYSTDRESTWNLSWTAREQLDASADSVNFEVIRKTINPQECAELEGAINRFYMELEGVLQTPVLLSEIPQEHQLESITVDGTSYILQMWTGARALVIYPDRDIDVELDNASGALMRVISGCSAVLPGSIEEHYGW